MPNAADLQLLKLVTSIPTAPFGERRVYAFVNSFAKKHKLRLEKDRFGNVLLTRPGTNRKANRLVLVAHTDHPGMVAQSMTETTMASPAKSGLAKSGSGELIAYFRGGVTSSFVQGARVRFFTDSGEVAGKVLEILDSKDDRPTVVLIRVKENVPAGSIGMFDLGEAKVVGKRLHSRVCDDLAGVSSALAAIARRPGKSTAENVADFCVLLTRGEEVGFIGALAAVKYKTLVRKSDLLVSIECSAEQPVAQQGKGVVLRVGDRTSIFNSSLSHFIHTLAQELAKEDKSFQFQRALMPGGTCEATAFDAFGHTAAAVCVALGNYHNMNKTTGKLAAETVHIDDWHNMVELFVALASRAHEFRKSNPVLRAKLTKLLSDHEHLLNVK